MGGWFVVWACLAADAEGEALIRYAHQVVASVVRQAPSPAVPSLGSATPVFVTLEVDGVIRGCRGSLATRSTTLAGEIADAARSAAQHDPRYRPLVSRELARLKITVTLVERLEPIEWPSYLSPEHGLVFRSGSKVGVVLPWEGKDPEVRRTWAYRKAGVPVGSAGSLWRLIGQRFRG
jgi:AMMECR1 domain-containing protein